MAYVTWNNISIHTYSTDGHTVLSSTMLQCGILQYNLGTVCSMYVYTACILEYYTCTLYVRTYVHTYKIHVYIYVRRMSRCF